VGDPHGQVVDIDVLADDLAEPLIAVVPLAREGPTPGKWTQGM